MTIQTMRDFGIGEGQLYIGGRWVDSASKERREIENPKNESVVAAVASSTTEDADRAVAAARKAQPEWGRRTPMERGALLQKACELDRREQRDAGASPHRGRRQTSAGIAHRREFRCPFAALRRRERSKTPGRDPAWREPRRADLDSARALCVVAGITAWNFPAALFARKVGPALVTGNTVVVKPHELTPLTTLVLGELSRRAGIPEGVINIVVGDGRTVGAHLVSHKGTDLISMTGSVRAGGEIYALGAERIKPIRLELGGKAPFIVMDDADIDKAVDAAVTSKFFFGGSVCTCNDRMYLHKKIHDAFLDKFLAKVKKLKVGDPTSDVQVGPRISAVEVNKLQAMKAKAIEQKATPLIEGKAQGAGFERGHWFFPTIFSVKSNDLEIMKQETFGPLIAAMAVDDFDQALAYANDSDYGLSAYLFTRDNRKIMRAVNELEFGEIYVNRPSGESPHGFHTGFRKSGLGGEDGQHGIEGFMHKKTLYNNYA